jgi:2'-5' RNA ligase
MRSFIAAELPAAALRQLTATQHQLVQQLRASQLDRCVRWTPASNIHLTLRFLGDIDESQCATLVQGLPAVAARYSPLAVRVDGLGCFPNTARPSVIWCGLQGDLRRLVEMQQAVDSVVRSAAIAPDEKGFKPHLTIARTQRGATGAQLRAVGAVVADYAALYGASPVDESTSIDELLLLRSELTPSGPVYTRLGVFPLVGG